MRKTFVVSLCVLFALSLLAAGAVAKNTQPAQYNYNKVEVPQATTLNPTEIGGSMFQAAAVNTVIIAYWQLDTALGGPDKTGWTEVDVTTQIKFYWHVDGTGCSGVPPIAGNRSMWCGQAASAEAPWCGWDDLPGYGNGWDQSLVSTVSTINSIAYTIKWESEGGYDFTYLEWWDAVNAEWVRDASVNAGAGRYDAGPTTLAEASVPGNADPPVTGPTKARFHFVSDGAWSDEDGLYPTIAGAVMVDNVSINGGAAEGFEAACDLNTVGVWTADKPAGYGEFGELHLAQGVVQEDPCSRRLSHLWGWFDDYTVTNYGCGGWPLQGAMPYGPNTDGLYMENQAWSPWFEISGVGSEFILEIVTYRDLPGEYVQYYYWGVRTKIGAGGCPTGFQNDNYVYYGGQKDWIRTAFQVGTYVPGGSTHMQVYVGAIDMCPYWCDAGAPGICHSHAPLIDQPKVMQVAIFGPQYTIRHIDVWQDNFPDDGTITGPARCDMARDLLPNDKSRILPGDSLKIIIADPSGLADDNTARPGKACYIFVKPTDRFGNPRGYAGVAMQSPDNRAYGGAGGAKTDPNFPALRWPNVALAVTPAGWQAYKMDYAYTEVGGKVKNGFCGDLMDIGGIGPHVPHVNENVAANTGIFVPGDVIWYFFGAKNTLNQWSFTGRELNGQGQFVRTGDINYLATPDANGLPHAACEWSVLPDAGREPGDLGDILLVDDADDRGGPAQAYFDWAFKLYGLTDRVDRFDVLGPSSTVGNSLASRVKSIAVQMIGEETEIYQKVLWNCTDLSIGLMGDGGIGNPPGTSAEKSDDFALCFTFLNTHPDNPGWAYWGDDVVEDWSNPLGGLLGAGAVAVRGTYMAHALNVTDQSFITGITSPQVLPFAWASESFIAFGGCAVINDFDAIAPGPVVVHRYATAAGPIAAVSQVTANSAVPLTFARFYLAGFAFNFIRDDDALFPPDYAPHLKEVLSFFENEVGDPVGVDPVAINRLDNNYPNPFNPTTTIKFSVAERGHVTLKIYNAAGQLVRTLVDEEKAPVQGGFTAQWNGLSDHGQPVASGVYFYQLTAKNFSQTKKMVLLK